MKRERKRVKGGGKTGRWTKSKMLEEKQEGKERKETRGECRCKKKERKGERVGVKRWREMDGRKREAR